MNSILSVGQSACVYKIQWHSHNCWELVYCTGGQGEFRFENGSILPYQQGDAVAIPPNERHTNISIQGASNIRMTMTEPFFTFRGAFRVSDEDGNLLHAFSQAKFYFLSDIQKRELVLGALGELIVSYMIVYRNKSELSEPVDRLRNVILRRYDQVDFALDEAVRQLPFHYDYLRKLFKKEMGVTPLEYMTRLRMKKAESLLSAMWTREHSVAEVARMCGYDDALYFSRVFKKTYGCSPSAFGKQT